MSISLHQAVKVGSYIFRQKVKGKKRFPLVLMLEPLFRCNLECAGCGKIQYPEEILNKRLTPEQCFQAADECGAPVVTIAGGKSLIHNEIGEIVQGLVDRKRFVYLCTNAILLEKYLDRIKPSTYLTLSVHLDGLKEEH
ncbi:MAG: adenosyl-hopene transferase HpnH, partial [Nitrospirae bacterium]|nr:adenosyl-hopene transferase HpnH [Nitrospirota bacterium]